MSGLSSQDGGLSDLFFVPGWWIQCVVLQMRCKTGPLLYRQLHLLKSQQGKTCLDKSLHKFHHDEGATVAARHSKHCNKVQESVEKSAFSVDAQQFQ